MADPFDTTGSDIPGGPSQGLGSMVQSPSFWQNLASFGANMSLGANARTPQGFLANGNGFAGPLGAGVLGAQQSAMQNAQARSELAARGAQTQGQQIQNQKSALQLPYLKALTGFQTDMLGQMSGGLPGAGTSTPMGQPDAQPTSLTDQPFVIPPAKRQKLVEDAVSGTPVPPQVVDGLVNYESGWNANSRDPRSGAFGLGAVLPSTAAAPGYGMAPVQMTDLANPPNALKFTAQYLYGRGKQMGMTDADWKDPSRVAGVLAAYHGPSVDANGVGPDQYVTGVGGKINAGPSWQVAQNGATSAPAQPGAGGVNMPAAQAMQVSQQYRTQAVQMRLAGLDATPYEQAAQQFQEYALAGPKAGAVAGAQLPYKLQEDRSKPFDLRQGGMHVDPLTGQTTKNPDRVEITNPDGSKGFAYMSPPSPGETGSGTAETVTDAKGAPIVSKNSPQITEFQESRGKDFAEQAQKIDASAEGAVEDNFRWDQMKQESQSWQMGNFAPTFGAANAYLKSTADLFGINMPGLDQKVGDFQAFNKNAGQLVRTAVHETSARASQQEYGMIAHTLPTAATSQQAFAQISDQMQGLNDWRLAQQKFMQQYVKSGANPDGFNVAMNSQLSPGVFLLHRMNQSPEGQQQAQAMIAKLQNDAMGRTMLNRLMTKYSFAQQNGYFDDGQPQQATQ